MNEHDSPDARTVTVPVRDLLAAAMLTLLEAGALRLGGDLSITVTKTPTGIPPRSADLDGDPAGADAQADPAPTHGVTPGSAQGPVSEAPEPQLR